MLERQVRLWLLLLLFVCPSCSSTRMIKIVDINGRPIEGAVVVSEQGPYILQSWKFAAVITDRAGWAKVVADRGYVFHEGFYPIIDASELDDGLYWSAPAYFESRTTLYRVQAPDTPGVHISNHTVVQNGDEEVYAVPITGCQDARVTYNIKTSKLTVSSDRDNLINSKRFYFETGDGAKQVGRIGGRDRVAFYCEAESGLSKVGVASRWKGARRGVREHTLVILEAHDLTTDTYLEPRIKCLDDSNLARIRGVTSSGSYPKVYVSDNLEQRIVALRRDMKCFDAWADRLFPYLADME